MAKQTGIDVSALPSSLHVHHIDGDSGNNHPDNLALTTSVGHRAIHQRYVKSLEDIAFSHYTLAEIANFLMSWEG